MRAPLLAILPLLAISGCSVAPQPDRRASAAVPSTASATAAAGAAGEAGSSTADAGGAKAVARSDALLEFKLSYPAAIGAIPPLASLIERRAATVEREMRAAAQADQADAARDGFPFRAHYLQNEWRTLADLPAVLSLRNNFATYTGGAHGMYGSEALVWDRRSGRTMQPADLFASAEAFERTLRPRFCRALDAERATRRSGDGKLGGAFDDCPPFSDLTLLLGSTGGQRLDRVTLVAGPYVAGPYAEGAYEIDLPLDATALEAVRPAFRAWFDAGQSGAARTDSLLSGPVATWVE